MNPMKINHLPEIDLARYAPLSADEKRRQLRTHGLFKPTLSYRPLRSVHPDIFNLQLRDLECPPSPWSHIEKRIREECASRPDWLDANVELAELLYRHVSAKRIKSYQ